ncbi:hypothetical protein [Enterococcus sp. HY326]|uniref:hypothetical protein n=1 Tax=Enterococcus sp. HY326 TaxID=2971265 RepID=UPI00223FDF67|nr:hypothetical protein [Enterococcus sp. HY326]
MIHNKLIVRPWALIVPLVLTVFAIVDLVIGNLSPLGVNFFKYLILSGKILIPLFFYILAFYKKK